MADYQAQIRLAVQGLDQLQQLEQRLKKATGLLGRLEGGQANVGQAASSADRRVAAAERRRAIAESRLRTVDRMSAATAPNQRDIRGRFIQTSDRAERQRIAEVARIVNRQVAQAREALQQEEQNQRLINGAQRRYVRAIDRTANIVGSRQNAALDQQQRVAGVQQRIGRESRINYLNNLFQGRQREFSRGGAGISLTPELQQQARNVQAAWDVANAGGRENLQLMQRLATEMAGIVRQQNEINRAGAGRSVAFEAARRGQERLDVLAGRPGADPAKVRRLRAQAADVISAENRGDIIGARDATRRMNASIARYTRELDAAAREANRQAVATGRTVNRQNSWASVLERNADILRTGTQRATQNQYRSPIGPALPPAITDAPRSSLTGARRGLPPTPGSPAARSLQFTADARSFNRQSNWQAALQQLSETAETIRAGQAKVRQSWQTAFAQADDIRSALQGAASSRRVNVKSSWQKALMQLQEVDSQLRGVESGSQVNVKSSWQKALGQMEAIRDDLRGVQTTRQSVIKKSWQTALGEMQGIGNELRLATKSNRTRIVASWQKALTEGQQIAEDMRNPRRGRPTGLFQGNLRDAIGEGLIGGAFPLLFGQGLGASAGGLAGGFGGGLLGGTFGFGLSLVGTALGSAVDRTVQGLQTLAGALKSPTDTMAALEASGFRVSDSLKFQVQQLESVGRAYDAQTLVLQEVERRLGGGSVRELNALDSEQKRLQDQYALLAAELQRGLLPAMVGAVSLAADYANALNAVRNIGVPEWLLNILSVVNPGFGLARAQFQATQQRGRDIAAGPAGNRRALPQGEIFAAETERINRVRAAEDMQRDIQRGELDLLRRKQDIEFSIADQRRAESDYEKEVADYRWSVEQRVLEARTQAIRAEQEVANARSQIRVAEIGLEFDQRVFDAPTDRQKEILEASKNFLQTQEQVENTIQQNKIETELRIEQLKQEQINRERQLEREKEQLEQRRDQLLRGRAQIERSIVDNQMAVADYQRETAEKILNAWRQMMSEMQGASNMSGGGSGGGVGAAAATQIANQSFNANATAWARAVRFAEGTAGPRGYNTMFTGRQFSSFADHPRRLQSGGGYTSDAAGAYQFLSTTWDSTRRALGLQDFSPASQDRGFAYLAARRGVNVFSDPFTPQNVAKLAPEWASLPTLSGGSFYGQPSKRFSDLERVFRQSMVGAAMGGSGGRGGFNGTLQTPTDSLQQLSAITLGAPVSIPAPARPTFADLPGAPDTSAMQRGMAEANTQTSAAVREAQGLLERLQSLQEQAAFDNLRRAIQGDSGLAEARDRLRLEQLLFDAGSARNELEAENLELSAAQRLEYEKAVETLLFANKWIGELVSRGLSPERAAILRSANANGFAETLDGQEIERETLSRRNLREFINTMQELQDQAALTGAGLRAGLIGPMAEAFEEAQRRGYDTTQTQEFVERTRVLQDQQLIWGNLAKDITNVSDAIAGGLTQGLADVITGARTMKDVGREVLDSIANTFLDSAQQQLSVVLQRSFAGLLGGEGGVLTSIFGSSAGVSTAALTTSNTTAISANTAATMANTAALGAAGIAGGASGAITSGISGIATSGISTLVSGGISAAGGFGGIFGMPQLVPFGGFFAKGGSTKPGEAYLVGEEGPELFIPGISGRVLSANETADYLTDAEIRALEGAAEAADGSTGIGGNSTTNVDARRTSNRSDTSQRFDSSSASSYVQQQARSIAAAAGGNGASSSTSSESSLFSDTRAMINTANAVMQQRESESSIMEAVRSDSEQGRSVTVEWRKVGDLDVVTREQLIGAMTQAERRGARKGKEMVLSGVKRDPSFRRQMR